jgi:hypothetical protein
MVKTKVSMVTYCERENTRLDDYLEVYERISAALDTMRIVHCNVGETDQLIGLYPYAPLHDMRRALESLDPRYGVISNEQRKAARAAVQQSFTALRETFLEELDIEQPTHGQLVSGARRVKRSGATRATRALQKRQQRDLAKRGNGSVDNAATVLLAETYEREQTREGAESITRL